jgi:hypothetical protein
MRMRKTSPIIVATAAARANAVARERHLLSTQQPATQGIAARRQTPAGHRQRELNHPPSDVARREASAQPAEPTQEAREVQQSQGTIDQGLRI